MCQISIVEAAPDYRAWPPRNSSASEYGYSRYLASRRCYFRLTSSFRFRINCKVAGCQTFLSGLSLDGIWSVMPLRSNSMFAPLPCSPRATRSGRAGRVFVQPSLEAQLRPLACRDPLSLCAACGRAALRCVLCFVCKSWTRAGTTRECVFGLASAASCRSWRPMHCWRALRVQSCKQKGEQGTALVVKGAMYF